MKLNKITSFILLILLLTSVVPAFAQEEVAATSEIDLEKYNETVDFITSLEIYSFSDKKADETVTRAMFAKMVADLMGISEDYSASEHFTDVLPESECADEIGAMASLGIMNGVGNDRFLPDEPITYRQAIKTIVTALGYNPVATAAGGYSDGYMRCAYSIGIVDNAPYDFDAPLTFDTAANLIKFSAEAEVYEIVYLSDNRIYYGSYEENTVLSVYHDVYQDNGKMTDNGITAINSKSQIAVDCCKIGGRVLTGADKSERKFLGYNVEYYYRPSNNELLYVWVKPHRNDVVTVNAENILTDASGFSQTCLVAEVNGKTKKYKIDRYADFIYNGSMDESFTVNSLKIKDGLITLLDADLDGDYELVFAEEYVDIVARSCNPDSNIIYSKYSSKDYALINYSDYKMVVFENGNAQAAPSSIKEDMVISVFLSKDKSKARFVLSDNTQEITAETVTADEDGTYTILFNNTQYGFSGFYMQQMKNNPVVFPKPAAGNSYKAYLNYEGNISMLTETRGRLQYAYFMAAGSKGTIYTDKTVVKLHLDTDDTVVVPVADKITFDGAKGTAGSAILSDSRLMDAATGEAKPQLVLVRIDAKGELREIDVAVDSTQEKFGFNLSEFSLDFVSVQRLSPKAVNGIRTYNGHQLIGEKTKVFVVNNNTTTLEGSEDGDVNYIDYETFKSRYGSCYIKMYDADESWMCKAIVVSEPVDISSRTFTVTDTFMQTDPYGETRRVINGYWDRNFKSLMEFRENALYDAVVKRYPGSDGEVYVGDVFEVTLDVNANLIGARMVYSPARDTNPDYCFFDMNGEEEMDDDSNNYILGYPCYVDSTRIGTYSKANDSYTSVNGSVGATAEKYWITMFTSSVFVLEYDCETREVRKIAPEEIPSSAQIGPNGYELYDSDTKVLLKRTSGGVSDVLVITNMGRNYN